MSYFEIYILLVLIPKLKDLIFVSCLPLIGFALFTGFKLYLLRVEKEDLVIDFEVDSRNNRINSEELLAKKNEVMQKTKEIVSRYSQYIKRIICSLTIVWLLCLVLVLIPSQKEMLTIVGGSYVTSNKDLQEFPKAALNLINEKLKKYARE